MALGARPSHGSRAIFFRSLAVMFNAGVLLTRGLDLLSQQMEDRRLAAVCQDLSSRLASGQSLPTAMAAHARTFSDMQLRLTQIGVVTGSLGVLLERMADYEEKQAKTLLQIRSALTYPAFLFVLCLGLVTFLPPFLFGGLLDLAAGSSTDLPWLTRGVMLVSGLARSPLFYLVLAALGAAGAWLGRGLLRQPELRARGTAALMRLPALGPLIRTLAVTQFARALEILARMGVRMDQALELAASASDNILLKRSVAQAIRSLLEGVDVAGSLDGTGFFPRLFTQSIQVGEESGELSLILSEVVALYEVTLDHAFETMAALLEPLALLVMGIVAGLTVVGTMLPLMKLVESL